MTFEYVAKLVDWKIIKTGLQLLSPVESSSTGDDCEGSGGMEVEITDRTEDPPQELIPVIEEDSDDISILEENWDPIPIPPPCIRNTENVEIIEMASQVSCQRCIWLLR